MAVDIATLAIKVENGDVVKATSSLNTLEVAGGKAEASTTRLTRRMALLEIQAREMDSALSRSQSTTGKLVSAMGLTEEAASRLGHAFGALSVVSAAVFAGHKFIEETIAAQNAMAQLEAAVTATGGATGRTVGQLDALSMSLQQQTTFSDEAVKGAEAILLTFNKIKGENLDRATVAVTDLATRLGKDLPEAALQVGKALQDPVEGMNALTRLGIRLSASQKQAVQDFVDTGHAAEAQGVILTELEHRYAGAAAAAKNTLGGALKGLANDFGDLFEVSRGGTAGVVDAIHGLDSAVRTLGQNMGAVVKAAELVAAVFAGRMVTGLAKAAQAQVDLASAAGAAITMQREAASNAVATATAQQAAAQRTLAGFHAEAAEIERLIVLERERAVAARANAASVAFQLTPTNTGATGPAADYYGRKQQEAQLAAATAARTAALEAEAAAIAAEEALEARRSGVLGQAAAAEVAATEATAVRTAAIVREGEVIAATSLVARAGAAATGLFGAAITALGGPISAAIIAATAINAALDAYGDHLLKAAEQTDAQRQATEAALATAHARAAAQRKETDELSEAAQKFAALSEQRNAELGKLTALNNAYRQSDVALSILGIRYDAQIQKSGDAKEHHGRELAALNALTDAITRQKVEQVLLNDQLQREAQLRSVRAANADALRSANEKVITAGQDAPTAERTQNRLDELNKLQDAERKYHDDVRRATAAQRADAKIAYDETVARIHKESDLNDQAITKARQAATAASVRDTVRDTDTDTAAIIAMTQAELDGVQAVADMRVQLAGNEAVQRAVNDAVARGTELTDAQAASLRTAAEAHERAAQAAEQYQAVQRRTADELNSILTDLANHQNPLKGIAERLKADLIRSISEALSRKWTLAIGKILGIERPTDVTAKAGTDMLTASQVIDNAATRIIAGLSAPTTPTGVATQRFASQFEPKPPTIPGATPPIVPREPSTVPKDGALGVIQAIENKLPKWIGSIVETARKYAGPAFIGYEAGVGVGESAYSTSHGALGNYARGALGGAASGAIAGAAIAGPVGAAVGAVAGFVGGIIGVHHASDAAAKATAELRKQLELNMASLRASVTHDDLGQAIAQANAQRETLRKQIEDAYSGGGANSDTVKERNRQLAEMNALEDRYIAQLKEEAAAKSRYFSEDLAVEQERARAAIAEAQGNTAEAARLRKEADQTAYNEEQNRRLEEFARTHDIAGNAADAAQYAQLQQTVALNEQAYALKQSTAALNALTTSVNTVTGFKLDDLKPYIQEFAQGRPDPRFPQPLNPIPLPATPFTPPTSPLTSPMPALTVNPTVNATVNPALTVQPNITLPPFAPPVLPPNLASLIGGIVAPPDAAVPALLRDLLRTTEAIRGAMQPMAQPSSSFVDDLSRDPMRDLVHSIDVLRRDAPRLDAPTAPITAPPPVATPRAAPAPSSERLAPVSVTIAAGAIVVQESKTPQLTAQAITRAFLSEVDKERNAGGGLASSRSAAIDKMKLPPGGIPWRS